MQHQIQGQFRSLDLVHLPWLIKMKGGNVDIPILNSYHGSNIIVTSHPHLRYDTVVQTTASSTASKKQCCIAQKQGIRLQQIQCVLDSKHGKISSRIQELSRRNARKEHDEGIVVIYTCHAGSLAWRVEPGCCQIRRWHPCTPGMIVLTWSRPKEPTATQDAGFI